MTLGKMKRSLQFVILIGAAILASWLLADVSVMALYAADHVTGRESGCYTDLEIFIGLKTPSGWIRPLEAVVGVALFIYLLSGAWHYWRRKGRAPNQLPEPTSGLAPGRGSS